MVVLADEILESFFETDLSASFKLEDVPTMGLPESNNGFLGGIWSNIATNDNKKLFNKFSDELGKTIGKHQVIHRPSIGRYTNMEEPRARESLLTPAMKRSASKGSLTATESTKVGASSTASLPPSLARGCDDVSEDIDPCLVVKAGVRISNCVSILNSSLSMRADGSSRPPAHLHAGL